MVEQERLLAVFDDVEERLLSVFHDAERALREVEEAEALLTPVPMAPPARQDGSSRHPSAVSDPLTMTMLQSLVEPERRVLGPNRWRRTWAERRRARRSEKMMLSAALGVTAVLITGAFAFMKLEGSVSSSRQAADRHWLAAVEAREAQIAEETAEAVATANLALTQPRWTDLLSFIKDGRRLLNEIRDHYSEWSYAPFHQPDIGVVGVEEDAAGVHRVTLRVDGSKPWASTIVMQRVHGVFKLDWASFEGRFDSQLAGRPSQSSVASSSTDPPLLGKGLERTQPHGPFLGNLPQLSLEQDYGTWWSRGSQPYLGMTEMEE